MSDGEEQKDGLGGPDSAIHAVAPKLLQEEGQVDVSSSPAFQCLDDLFLQGKLDGEKLAKLKSMYTAHHHLLQSTRESETELLRKAKDLHQEVQKQLAQLEKADHFPEGETTEVSRLRQELLKHSNELAQADERQYQLDFILGGLREENTMLEKEYSRMPKAEEIEKELKELNKFIEEMKLEVGKRNQECKSLKEELDSRDSEVKQIQGECEKKLFEEQNQKEDLVQVHSKPAHLLKQVDLMSRQLREIDDKRKALDSNIEDVNKELQSIESKKIIYEDEKTELSIVLDRQSHFNESKEREVDMFLKDLEFAKEKQAELIGDRATVDINLKHIELEKKTEHDVHSRKMREKDRDLKNLKKNELQLKVTNDGLEQVKMIYGKIKSQLDSTPKDDGSLFEKRKEMQKEVDVTKRTLAQQNGYTSHEKARVEQMILEQENLLREQANLRIDVVDLKRLAQIKADEREQKARDFVRAELRYQRAQEDLKTKNLNIQDSAKKYTEMQHKLSDFAKLYDVIKNERNKCVNLIQTSTQRASEMREKIKILQNEIEILRSKVNSKDRLLQKSHLKKNNAIAIRDSLRNEVSKQGQIAEENKEKRDQKRMDIGKLNDLINKMEENMVQLRKRYEHCIQERNDRGIKLIERNEEVCVFYEKLNVQGTMLRNGDVELRAREEEIRFLELEVAELKRLVGLSKKTLPKKKFLDNELVTTQIQLLLCREHLLDLEKLLENPNEEGRIRLLKGDDPKPEELTPKIEELEMRLAEKEETLLEKDLVFEEVSRLTERTKKKAETGKEDTLNLAKKVNEFQGKIKATTRKMMAMVSELSMNQANAMKLQQEAKEKEALLEQCYTRMERGEAPDEQTEREWLKTLRDEQRRKAEKLKRAEMDALQEQYNVGGDVYTTAEPRPNAYIPDDDVELPIPRPYGALAPFKPTEPGSTMRHIRKPVIKPIEI